MEDKRTRQYERRQDCTSRRRGLLRVCAAKRKFTQSSARSLWTYALVLHGAVCPYPTDLHAQTIGNYAPMFYNVTVSGFAKCPVFTVLSSYLCLNVSYALLCSRC